MLKRKNTNCNIVDLDITSGITQVNSTSTSVLDIDSVFVNPVIVNWTGFVDVHTGHPSPRYVAIRAVLDDSFVDGTAVKVALLIRAF